MNKTSNEQSVWKYIKERNTVSPAQLCRTALIDCTREYTYGQMFVEWEHYARVFSALGMTGENNSRVGIAGSISAEPLFAFYGLNMTGATVSMLSYPDFLPSGQWKTMVEKEKLTDLVLSDIMITPEMWPEIEEVGKKLGIKNIILLHSLLGGPCTGPAELFYNEFNYHRLKRIRGTVFMDDLMKQYGSSPITWGTNDPDHLAIITHTSGSTKGTRKPLPYTERAVNITASNFGNGFHGFIKDPDIPEQIRLIPSFDFSSFLCMCGVINSDLAVGDTVVLTFFGFIHPKFIRAIEYYKINVLFTSCFMIDSWLKRTDLDDVDFSSLKVFSCGGSYTPIDKLVKYTKFVQDHGFKGGISRGYGMSEAGGSQLYVPAGCMDDILGFPDSDDGFLVQDENDGKYYTAKDGIRTGILYIASDSLCTNELDGEVLFDFTKIKGKDYICTNDKVRVNENGSFSYAGRADKFFANNEGIRFESGIVENEVLKQPGVEKCAIVPVLDKRIHDTVPVLYIVPDKGISDAPDMVKKILIKLYIENDLISVSSLPSQLILVDDIPLNSNGKIDVFRITRDRLKGEAYNIMPRRKEGKLIDIDLEYSDQLNSITGGTLPEGMGGGSALGIYEIFNS
ncbi:Acyl-CoA synthetase (AMP-forming)/AMP-acid ligase II [Lachnospiraceae bacterium NE2001]|nr:Acyl-CoA synthetase (AMP-forming)/AMP-acid ligase II [Lachnospiraceae bacterium NE2001]